MAWYTDGLVILRSLVGDEGTTYTDAKLKKVLAIGAYRVRQEVDFDTSYEVDLTSGSEAVTPDPTGDYDFINLMALKSAVVLLTGELKLAGDQSIIVQDGPSKIQVDKGKWIKSMLDWSKSEYDDYVKDYIAGNSKYSGVVMTPYTKEFIYPGTNSTRNGGY